MHDPTLMSPQCVPVLNCRLCIMYHTTPMQRRLFALLAVVAFTSSIGVIAKSLALREVDAQGIARAIKSNHMVFVFAYVVIFARIVTTAAFLILVNNRALVRAKLPQKLHSNLWGRYCLWYTDNRVFFLVLCTQEIDITKNPQAHNLLHSDDVLGYYLLQYRYISDLQYWIHRDGEVFKMQTATSQALISKLNKFLAPSITMLETKQKRTDFVNAGGVKLIAYVPSTDSPGIAIVVWVLVCWYHVAYHTIEKVAKKLHPEVAFGVITDAKMAKSYICIWMFHNNIITDCISETLHHFSCSDHSKRLWHILEMWMSKI